MSGDGVIYRHPLAYLLGLQGIALCAGTPVDGYGRWAPFYGEPGNQLLDIEQPVERAILDGLPVGIALDAACGTGRHGEYLASLGHDVIGVDTSPEMLARARTKVPEGVFHEGDLNDLHLVRVLRPGGHLVISDSRGLIGDIGLPLVRVGPDGEVGYMPVCARPASGYLAAALPLDLQVRRREEPRVPSPLLNEEGIDAYNGVPAPKHVPGEPPYIWSLHPFYPAATNAAWPGEPSAIVWLFQLAPE